MKVLQIDHIDSPIGTIVIVVDDDRLCSLGFSDYKVRMMAPLEGRYGQVDLVQTGDPSGISSLIRNYLAGDYNSLDGIQVNTGGTAFQREVWSALRAISPGTTMSYGELAKQLGRPA